MCDRFSHPLPATPPEVSLLLRAHAEQHWLSREVAPVAQQIETGACPRTGARLPAEQLPAALAYLEVIWLQAAQRAGDSDGALTCLDLSLPAASSPDAQALAARARRYHATVLTLRESLSQRVAPLLAVPAEACAEEPKSAAGAGCAEGGYAKEACGGAGEPAPSSSAKR
jgi:hypothetical protein